MIDNSTPESLNPLASVALDVRQVRTARGITQRALGTATGYSESYVNKVESGAVVPSERFLEGCDRAFGTGQLFVRQLRRALEGDHPSWFVPYLQLERKASQILDYSTLYVMGMLQTEEYARAVFRAGSPREGAAMIESRVAARIRRHEVMEREEPPLLWVILHEAALRQVVGSHEVMARQLDYLLSEAESPNITIQLLTFTDGAPALSAPFVLLSFDDGPMVLYAEGPQGGRPYENATTVGSARDTYDRLRATALGPDASLARLQKYRKEYTS